MKFAWVIALGAVAACDAGSSNSAADAGVDSGADSGDATDGGDSSGLDPLGDEDGDIVLNGVDVCPLVADPAQVDLDGDGVGWMCDPLESKPISVAPTGEMFLPRTGLGGYTMSFGFASGCNGPVCDHQILTVGPGGVAHAQTPADSWLSAFPQNGLVAHENHALWSMGDATIGDISLPSGTYSTAHTGTTLETTSYGVARFRRGSFVVVLSESGDATTHKLHSPQADGSLVTVATAGQRFDSPLIVGDNPSRLVFADPAGTYVREYVEGAASSQAIAVSGTTLSEGAESRPLIAFNEPGDNGPRKQLGFCINKDNKRYIVETLNDQLTTYEAPLSSCSMNVYMTPDRRLKVFSGAPAAYSLDGVFHSLADGAWDMYGSTLPAVVSKYIAGASTVLIIDEDGQHPLTVDGVGGNVTRGGGAIHFLSFRGSAPVLVRYRAGLVSEVALPAISSGFWKVFTTAEGAALATTSETAYVWPSQASTGTTIDFDNIDVLLRGSTTLFVASHNDVRSQPALYAYSEVSGAPKYSPLTPEVMQNVPYTMEMQQLEFNNETLPTEWFRFSKQNEFCKLVRVVVNAGTVSLEGELQCPTVHGVTPDGKLILESRVFDQPWEMWTLEGTTLTKVAVNNSGPFKVVYAVPVGHSFIESPIVLAWSGQVLNLNLPPDGQDTFVCSASHPERCWRIPGEMNWFASSPLDFEHPDGAHLLFLRGSPSWLLTSFKTVGTGDLVQPL